jgi:choline dehydrogenase-like flavoprotein
MGVSSNEHFDVIIVGAGISGSFIAEALTEKRLRCLLVEAGSAFQRHEYPREEIDANSRLYWSGGIEFNTSATIGFLSPRVVGGAGLLRRYAAIPKKRGKFRLDP